MLTGDGGGAAAPGAANSMKTGAAGKGPRVVDTDNVPRPQVNDIAILFMIALIGAYDIAFCTII
jgi:hypothetical protein